MVLLNFARLIPDYNYLSSFLPRQSAIHATSRTITLVRLKPTALIHYQVAILFIHPPIPHRWLMSLVASQVRLPFVTMFVAGPRE